MCAISESFHNSERVRSVKIFNVLNYIPIFLMLWRWWHDFWKYCLLVAKEIWFMTSGFLWRYAHFSRKIDRICADQQKLLGFLSLIHFLGIGIWGLLQVFRGLLTGTCLVSRPVYLYSIQVLSLVMCRTHEFRILESSLGFDILSLCYHDVFWFGAWLSCLVN